MESIYTPPSQFSGGFSKAMECVKLMALQAINKGFGEVGAQEYRWANVVIDEKTGNVMELEKLLKYPKYTEVWTLAAANEYGRLFQGCGTNKDGTQCVVGTNACHRIKRIQVLKDKITTYNKSVVDIRLEKAESKQVQFTAGGNILKYTGETLIKTALIEIAKLILIVHYQQGEQSLWL